MADAALAAAHPGRAAIELVVALLLIGAGLAGYLPFSATPLMLAAGWAFLWWRGPGWRGVGLRRPPSWGQAIGVGVLLGVGYQLLSLYAIEPLLARVTGAVPDVSVFRFIIGNERQLLLWLAISWTLAAFLEEMVFRGWLMDRAAELGGRTPAAWYSALVATSALFGIVHLYQGWSGILSTGLAGFVFGVAYLASGRNLWGAILAHGIMDTVGFTMIYLGIYPGL